MIRRLILMRHAKSSWKVAGMADRERPLNRRGRKDAPRMARELLRRKWAPTVVCSSSAQRTRETWEGMAPELPAVEATFHASLYLASLPAIDDLAADWPDSETGPVLLLGHNPGWEIAASTLGRTQLGMTTANAVLLEGSGSTWSEALRGPWSVIAHLQPRSLSDDT